MPHNKAITVSALPILVDCEHGEKEDGFATWAGGGPHQRAVRRFGNRDVELYRKTIKRDSFEKVGRLIGAIAGEDKVEISRWHNALIAFSKTESGAIGRFNPAKDYKHYLGWKD